MRKLKNLAALGKKSNKQKDSGSTHSKRGGPSYEQISARHMSEEFDAPTAKLYHQPNSARYAFKTFYTVLGFVGYMIVQVRSLDNVYYVLCN